MLGHIENLIKSSSLGILKKLPDEGKDGSLLLLKDSSKDGDKIWAAVGYPGYIFNGIRMYNSDGNSEELLYKLSYGVIFRVIESIIFGLTESSKLGEELVCK